MSEPEQAETNPELARPAQRLETTQSAARVELAKPADGARDIDLDDDDLAELCKGAVNDHSSLYVAVLAAAAGALLQKTLPPHFEPHRPEYREGVRRAIGMAVYAAEQAEEMAEAGAPAPEAPRAAPLVVEAGPTSRHGEYGTVKARYQGAMAPATETP